MIYIWTNEGDMDNMGILTFYYCGIFGISCELFVGQCFIASIWNLLNRV